MKSIIPYDSHVTITRTSGDEVVKDEWDEVVSGEVTVYDGKCSYHKGIPTAGTLLVHSDVLVIPVSDILFHENDVALITTKRGNIYKGVVKSIYDVDFVLFDRNETKIELKQVLEVTGNDE
jgi:hypothetical protein